MRSFALLLLIGLFSTINVAQTPMTVQWQKLYGGTLRDFMEGVHSSQQTSDGGFILAGTSQSIDGDVTGLHGGFDFWVVKTYPSGEIQWQKCYGGSNTDFATSVQQTSDGGFIVAGGTNSTNDDVTNNHGQFDFWVIKTDSSGSIQWQNCYGGSNSEYAYSIIQTNDNGYVVTGFTGSYGGQVVGNHGGGDIWTLKISSSGAIQWSKCYGGLQEDWATSIQPASDGGYITTGWTNSNDGDVSGLHGGYDYWVVKTSSDGSIQWQKCYGGSYWDKGESIIQSSDNGYIVAGSSKSYNGDVTSNHGKEDYWIVRLDSLGNILWEKSYGGSEEDIPYCIIHTTDGGYMIAGTSNSDDGDITNHYYNLDFWLVKINSSGAIEWQHSYGGDAYDYAYTIQQTTDGAYFVAGHTGDQPAALPGHHGYDDYIGIKLCKSDPLSIVISNPTYCVSTTLTATSGFASYLWNTGQTTQSIEVTNGGNYQVQAVNLTGCPSIANIQVPDPIPPYGGDPIYISISNTEYCQFTSLTASVGFVSYNWNTGQTAQSIDVTSGGLYSVVATNDSGCTSLAQITVPGPLQPYSDEQICLVTIDSPINKNVVVVEKTLNVGTDSIFLYRKEAAAVSYHKIGVIPINEESVFIDESADPLSRMYYYAISVKDSCDHESNLSPGHKAMHLIADNGGANEVILYWNAYEGFAYNNFNIYRSNQGGAFFLIASLPNNSFTYTDYTPPSGLNLYQVRVLKESPCMPIRSFYEYSCSNTVRSGTDGIADNQTISFRLYPNPATERIYLSFPIGNSDITEKISIINVTGELVSEQDITGSANFINISTLPPGLYFVRMSNDKTVEVGKFVKQ
jgi:hypothetical protein